jgi:ribonuclease J
MNLKPNEVGVFALGGLLEVGKNAYAIEYRDEIIVIDFGSLFPDSSLLGIDLIIPDLDYLHQKQDNIVGLFITHGHLDHIGAIPMLLDRVKIPVIYCCGLAKGLIEKNIPGNKKRLLKEFKEDDHIKSKYFDVSFYLTNHSIPDSYGLIVKTPNGVIVHTGDFKVDLTPVGEKANFAKMAATGSQGVMAMLSDSTNSMVKGFTLSESKIGASINSMFQNITGRIIIASFASNLHRVKQIIEVSIANNRKIAISGRSMENNIKVGRELGYIDADESFFVDINRLKNIPPEEITIISTGSQGEPMAALSRLASGQHRSMKIEPGDTVIFSSSPIPGNEYQINEIVNKLYQIGAHIIEHSPLMDTHTSGHGGQGDQQLLMTMFQPKHFIPIHGEFRMLYEHKKSAMELGIPEANIHMLTNGEVLAFDEDQNTRIAGRIPVEPVYVRGGSTTELSNAVLRQRKQLSESGIVTIIITLDKMKNKMLVPPVFSSRGYVYLKENKEVTKKIVDTAAQVTNDYLKHQNYKDYELKQLLLDQISQITYELTERSPIVIPVIMETL